VRADGFVAWARGGTLAMREPYHGREACADSRGHGSLSASAMDDVRTTRLRGGEELVDHEPVCMCNADEDGEGRVCGTSF